LRTILRIATMVLLGCLLVGRADAAKIRLLIIDGQNNHDWKATTPILQGYLAGTGRFDVDVVTTPPRDAPADAWNSFRPDFKQYQVVLSNYNGQDWPQEVETAFEKYMADGGGLVIYHAANNPFPKWDAWTKMVGLSWQGPDFGDRIAVDDAGKVIRTPKGQGPGAGHDHRAYALTVRDSNHPIMHGLPAKWTHGNDELYKGQRGPAVNMRVLATAYSDSSQGGTGANEPLVWVVTYGNGRVFVSLLGHDVSSAALADTLLLVGRGAQWVARSRITLPVPPDFPRLQPDVR